ncbi:MAG: excinuclease ABC subunit UvrC, partial [Synechococcaceae cyanobacterium]|nr:excinuclease ABC subunit UvrC [Synechococcaceae cyanobacterium]
MKPAANTTSDFGSQPLILDEARLKARLREIPSEPGCYLMRDREDRILYIGKAKVLRSRVRSYFQSGSGHGHSPRIRLMVRQVCEIEVIVTDSEAEALALESNLIKQNQPHFNVLLKDDKKYPYLCITWSELYPRIFITRRRRFRSPLDRFYGPYVDVGLLRRTLALVKRVFPLRQRPLPLHRDRTCLNYDIGRCPGVCQEKISSEDYHKTLRQVAMVFQGRNEELLRLLHQQMQAYAERLDFEKAARVRDQLQGLESLTADQKMSVGDTSVSRDVIALASDGRVAAVQLFQMRAGKLVGRLGYMADAIIPSAVREPTNTTSKETSIGIPCETPRTIPSVSSGDSSRDFRSDVSGNNGGDVSGEISGNVSDDARCRAPIETPLEPLVPPDAAMGLILQRVIEEHYSQVEGVEIPPELLLQVALPQQELIGAWLSELRGRRVKLSVPQRSQKAELIELVVRNASYELQRAQRASEQNQMATEDLAQLLDLTVPPRRIEGYDISHIQGSDAVASQVVFIDGLPAK